MAQAIQPAALTRLQGAVRSYRSAVAEGKVPLHVLVEVVRAVQAVEKPRTLHHRRAVHAVHDRTATMLEQPLRPEKRAHTLALADELLAQVDSLLGALV
jgi:hypothetical protein